MLVTSKLNAKKALLLQDSALTDTIYRFMNLNFNESSFEAYKASLPATYELPEFYFWPIKGESLFEKYEE